MPKPVVITIAAIAFVLVLIIAAVLAVRLYRRRRLVERLDARDDDQVHYAFIVNPSKPQAAERKRHIKRFCAAKGLTEVEFIETRLDKDGRACALEALRNGADVIVAVGGDGTVRTVASAVSGTGHALGIIPIGTGNLFARNMGIPVDDIDAALTVATSHGSRHVDVGRLTLLDDRNADHGHAFLIIAGIGFDAVMIGDTDPELKKNISWLAYFVSGVKNLFAPKYRGNVTITSADGSTHTISGLAFRTFMAGNCGQIPVFSLMPDASYDDGILDFEVIDTSGGLLGWANLFGDVVHQTISGKAGSSPLSTNSTIDQIQGVSAEIMLEKPVLAQVDGDMLPATKHLRFDVERKSLCVRVPEVDPDLSVTGIIPTIKD
ncbi:diacylglycerol/lipid kinase family protein [Bifidobacterium scardovii]|uniref:DeoR family transcriptional regulator n=1 Tax=Bifidobacterium scardovii TaxID=158787 RepID=A0A087DK62_9BIFI|nr:diacylglycerol kinase family protein [Bifidobacterium scardovii]KFI95912.1 DeoR family transcriptional regulator [Bifidobacterium scardovii]MDK6350478.1 diacylglycerol kinase family protein [Bifidobacterium scardovii]MDU8981507.1 diacylglycerol kinase family protein [Bifidobacterium scardovii]